MRLARAGGKGNSSGCSSRKHVCPGEYQTRGTWCPASPPPPRVLSPADAVYINTRNSASGQKAPESHSSCVDVKSWLRETSVLILGKGRKTAHLGDRTLQRASGGHPRARESGIILKFLFGFCCSFHTLCKEQVLLLLRGTSGFFEDDQVPL